MKDFKLTKEEQQILADVENNVYDENEHSAERIAMLKAAAAKTLRSLSKTN